ncbi:hypothetical protein M2138_001643 [Dysgonomonadaceae bacterium PH5-43]|nr:hypothetical protein [Dysgonomonadaceae bacterium PH5-43]
MTIGLLYIATGKYSIFWKDFYLTAKKYLFPNVKKKFFVFTDLEDLYADDADVIKIDIPHREWPYSTLLRFEMFLENEKLLKDCDYLLFYNANTIFTEVIEPNEILPNEDDNYLVALSNNDILETDPNKFAYDRNPQSTAYIPYGAGTRYYRGGFNGGRIAEFMELAKTCKCNIDKDEENGVMALWHDESHLNKYLLNRKIKIVGSEYGKAEEWDIPKNAKVIFVDKNRVLESDKLRKFKQGRSSKYSISRFMKKLLKKFS